MSRSTVAPASAFSAVERAIRAIGDEERKVLVRLKAGRTFNDTVHQGLASGIVVALSSVEGLSPHSISVEVERGSVTLTGNVDRDVQRAAIETGAGGICGAEELNNPFNLGGRSPLAS
ncbi:BON domain-containing protein [Paraburkholderia sp. XV]|uniref:BON domain-containing protein n=1 Tax=Paraburkholderia sp. XV TaxID=2831520 RepID=UPI001CD4B531|nr:BON domain-containing protein [Paraburkholderia sp. XV]